MALLGQNAGLHLTESGRRRLIALFVAAASAALLLWNTARWTAVTDYSELGAHRRLWSDQAAAIGAYLDARFGPAAPRGPAGDAAPAYRPLLVDRTRLAGVRPWQPWRTIGPRPFLRARVPQETGAYDDPGRALLLAAGFRLLGGISPFLILWLGALAAVPLVAWAAWELVEAGFSRAAAVFLPLLACSPYFVEALALTRYAVGFYLLGLLALLPLAAYALLGRPSPRGLLLRALAGGLCVALFALCRSSVLLLLPGFALALLAGLRRSPAPARGGRALLAAALAAAVSGPYLVVRQSEHHGVWSALWEGLGDFDREKGHAWSDADAEEASRRAGAGALWTPGSEAVFRRLVVDAVRQDPLWYGEILLKRAAATVTLWKLWPWRPSDGTPIRPRSSWNEGFMDKYYGYTTTADHLGVGPVRVELPIILLLLPPVLLGVAAARTGRGRAAVARARAGARVAGVVALATLPLPVAISTAAAQEAQAVALAYLLSLAFLGEAVRRGSAVPVHVAEAEHVADGSTVDALRKDRALDHAAVPKADA